MVTVDNPLNIVSYLMLDLDVFVQDAAEFIVVSVPLERLLSTLLKEAFPILRGAKVFSGAR